MFRLSCTQYLVLLCLTVTGSAVCLGDWRAQGRYECEDSPDTFCSGSHEAADCAAAHVGNMTALLPSAPTCQFEPGGPNPPPIYVDEGCINTMGGGSTSPVGAAVVKIVYTYGNGKRLGVERGGSDLAAARAAAEGVSLEWESRQDPAVPGTTFGMRDASSKKETIIRDMVDVIEPPMLKHVPGLMAPEMPPIQLMPEQRALGSVVPCPGTVVCPQVYCPPSCGTQACPTVCQPSSCQPRKPRCRLLRRLFGR